MKNEGLAEAPSSRFTGHWRTSAWEAAGLLWDRLGEGSVYPDEVVCCFWTAGQRMEKATSSSLCVFSSGSLLAPPPRQHSDSDCVAADASLAPVNSDVALLCEPSQAWFIIPVQWVNTAHSRLMPFPPEMPLSLPPFYLRVPVPASFPNSFPETWPDDLEVFRHLGVSGLRPTSSSQLSSPIPPPWTGPTSLLCATLV